MTRITTALATVSSLAFAPVSAQDIEKGWVAYEAGDYSSARQEWEPLAMQGNADAQSNLGRMFYNGNGVPRDIVMAHMWFSVADENNHRQAGAEIPFLEEAMTPADISQAQAMARECMSSNYQNCGY